MAEHLIIVQEYFSLLYLRETQIVEFHAGIPKRIVSFDWLTGYLNFATALSGSTRHCQ